MSSKIGQTPPPPPPEFNPEKGKGSPASDGFRVPPQPEDAFGVLPAAISSIDSTVSLPPTGAVRQAAPVANTADVEEVSEILKPIVDAVDGFGQFLSFGATQKLGQLAFGKVRQEVDRLPLSERAKVQLADNAISRNNLNTSA